MAVSTLDKTVTDDRAARILRKALEERSGRLTHADAMAVTGLPRYQAETALKSLVKTYKSHLEATDKGEIIYDFGKRLESRLALPLRERLEPVFRALWSGFKFVFKIAIVGTLIFYFVAFLAMLIAIMFARSSGDRDRDDGPDFFMPLIWFWGWGPGPYGPHDGYGRGARRPRRSQKAMYKKVFDYVFGPPEAPKDELGDEKILLAYIRENGGRITASDLVALTGWDYARAEQEASRLMASYEGEPEVTDDGVVLYVFKDLRTTAGEREAGARPTMAWERPLADRPLTGNEGGTDAAITLVNAFNLLAPLWIVPIFAARTGIDLSALAGPFLQFPLWFSSLFFAVPLARWAKESRARKRRARWNARLRVLRRIWQSGGATRAPGTLAEGPEEEAALEALLAPLEADVTAGEGKSKMLYSFPRLAEERAAVDAARQLAGSGEKDAGAVVFSSGGAGDAAPRTEEG